MDALAKLLDPVSVAVIGASSDPTKTAGRPIAYLRKHGFADEIFPVNPGAVSIDGLRCYPDIMSLPHAPDVGIVLLGAKHAHRAVRELAQMGTAAAIVLASGYGESGEAGARRQAELREAAGKMRLLGPNTIGLVNVTRNIPLSASGALEIDAFHAGNIGVVSQSGGILGALLSRAAARGIGLSKLISTGNEVDLDLADFLAHLVEDPDTKVIALYIESVRNPETFRAAALKAAAAGKPVVAYKVGQSEAGARAAVSHTGALAGSDRMYDALFEQLGIIRAKSFGNLLDISAALSAGRGLTGKRIAVLTSTGGAGTLVVDALGVNGFEAPSPDAITTARLQQFISGDVAAMNSNPIDVTLAGLQPDTLHSAIKILFESPSYDALIIIVGSSGIAQPQLMADALQKCLAGSDKPVIAYLSPHAPAAGAILTARGVPSFTEPESCAAALDGLWRAGNYKVRTDAPARPTPGLLADLPTGSLDEAAAKRLFARFGVPGAREIIVTNREEAERAARELGPRVALKILSSEILHKSDVGGVAINLTPQDIAARMTRMTNDVEAAAGTRPTRFLVQEMFTGGVELILGFHRDPLGCAIVLGMGGVTAELFRDTQMRLLSPGGLTIDEALGMARALKAWPLLNGYRGRPKADVEALLAAIVAFANMALHLGERLMEAEINPLFVLPEGEGVRAADGIAVLKP